MNQLKQTVVTPSVNLPGDYESFEHFKGTIQNTVQTLFAIEDNERIVPFLEFAKNIDHGAIHAWNVFRRSLEIAHQLENTKGYEQIDRTLLFFMSIGHDSGRFHISSKAKKQSKCERHHNLCGVAQVKLAQKIAAQNNTQLPLNEEQIAMLNDYIFNHDFFNQRLDGSDYQEPQSLEGQIVRLADRMSTDIISEVNRYWETGKRLGTPYYKETISLEERIRFSFPKIKEYIVQGKFDEFTFFLALISMSGTDFQNPDLANIYNEWAATKGDAIKRILDIGKEEGYSREAQASMEKTIRDYVGHFNIQW